LKCTLPHPVGCGPAFLIRIAAVVVVRIASDAGIVQAYAGGTVRAGGAGRDALAMEAFAAVAVCIDSAYGRGEADAHAVAGGVAELCVDVAAVGCAWLTGDTSIVHAYTADAVCVDSAGGDALAAHTFAVGAVPVVRACGIGEANTQAIAGGVAGFCVGVAALVVQGVAGGTSAVGKAKSGDAVCVVPASGDALSIDTFAAVAVRVHSAYGRGEADAHAVAGGVADFCVGVTAVVRSRLAGDTGIVHAYTVDAVCAGGAGGDTLALDTFAAVAVCVHSALSRGETFPEVIWSGPAFFVEATALVVVGIANGTSAVGKTKSGDAVCVVSARGDALSIDTFAAVAVCVDSADGNG